MSSGQQGTPNASDNSMSFFWGVIAIVIVTLFIWWLYRAPIVNFIFFIKHYEMLAITFFLNGFNSIAKDLHLPLINVAPLVNANAIINTVDPSKVAFDKVHLVSANIGNYFRYFTALVMIVFSVIMFRRPVKTKFSKRYSMDQFKKLEVVNWPEITPVLKLDLVKQDLNKGPWAMSKMPLDFCHEHNLVSHDKFSKSNEWSLDKGKALQIFTIQLGSRWRGVKALPIHVKAIFVILASCATRDRKKASRFMNQIALSADSTGKLDFTGIEEESKQYQKHSMVQWLSKKHAYTYTVFSQLLALARRDGVVACAEFIWLKPVDRNLWYVLQNVGRQVSFIESSGPFAHWKAEQKIRRGLKAPMVSEAVTALEASVADILYIPEGEVWHSSNAA